jgi:HD-GYP domain-containing protein (c-di-GMP phosphodiesterase class II)
MADRRLKREIIQTFMGIFILLFVMFSVINIYTYTMSLINLSTEKNVQVIKTLRDNLTSSLVPAKTEIETKYRIQVLNGKNNTFTEADFNFIYRIDVIDDAGIIQNTLPCCDGFIGIDMSRNQLFLDISQSETEGFLFGDVIIDNESGRYSVPAAFKEDGYVVMGWIEVGGPLQEWINLTYESSIVTVVDKSGYYLYHPESINVFERKVDPHFYKTKENDFEQGQIVKLNGKNHFVYSVEIPETSWHIMMYQDLEFIISPIISSIVLLMISLITMFLVIFVSGYLILKRIEKSLQLLNDAADNIYEGEYKSVDIDGQYDEFRRVMIKMNEMMSQIQIREDKIIGLNDRLETSYLNTMSVLTKTIEAKDSYTGNHCERVSYFSLLLGEKLQLSEAELYELRHGSLLHDIGKLSVSELLLQKPARLTDDEYEQIKQHSTTGYELIRDLPNLELAKDIVLYHHERFDGFGYPEGRAEEDIPLFARIVCIADAYDAMTSKRVYRKHIMSKHEAVEELIKCKGSHFDPYLVDLFIEALDETGH